MSGLQYVFKDLLHVFNKMRIKQQKVTTQKMKFFVKGFFGKCNIY